MNNGITIKKFIDFDQKVKIKEHILDLPGVVFSEIPSREYVSNVNLSHMLGYLRIIDRDKQKEFNHRDSLFKYSIGSFTFTIAPSTVFKASKTRVSKNLKAAP